MSDEETRMYLAHIVACVGEIEHFTEGVTKELFFENREKQQAVMRDLEIIGEAVKNISHAFRARHPHVAWDDFAGMRDVLIHQYFGVDLDLVWDAIQNDLPTLKRDVEEIMRTLPSPTPSSG